MKALRPNTGIAIRHVPRLAATLLVVAITGLPVARVFAAPPPITKVTSCTSAALQAAEVTGGHIQFTLDCPDIKVDFTLVLKSGTVWVDGTGHTIVLDVAHRGRMYEVDGGQLTLQALTLENGLVTGSTGGKGTSGKPGVAGVRGANGSHPATGIGGSGKPGTNGANGKAGTHGGGGGTAQGGAVTIGAAGVADFYHDTFINDDVVGGSGGSGGGGGDGGMGGAGGNGGAGGKAAFGGIGGAGGAAGSGGAGAPAGNGGIAEGGAIFNAGNLTVKHTAFMNDAATGGVGGSGGTAGPGAMEESVEPAALEVMGRLGTRVHAARMEGRGGNGGSGGTAGFGAKGGNGGLRGRGQGRSNLQHWTNRRRTVINDQ